MILCESSKSSEGAKPSPAESIGKGECLCNHGHSSTGGLMDPKIERSAVFFPSSYNITLQSKKYMIFWEGHDKMWNVAQHKDIKNTPQAAKTMEVAAEV